MAYGAQTRIMDGTLGRANCLVITMLWSVFKFFMVPLGFQLAAVFPPATYATLFAFVWLSYLVGDGTAEIVGQLFGKQKLRVWGIGEVNRKSVAGTWACFLGSLAICLWLVHANGLGARLGRARRRGVALEHRSSSSSRRAGPTTSRWRPPTRSVCSAFGALACSAGRLAGSRPRVQTRARR